MNTNVLNVFHGEDQSLRQSLHNLNIVNLRGRKFTKFIKVKEGSILDQSNIQNITKNQVNFQSLQSNRPNQLTGTALLVRYRDQSLLVHEKQKSLKQKILQKWGQFFSFVFREEDETITFRKDSSLLLVWNFVVLLSYIWNLFQIPISLFFTDAVYIAETTTAAGIVINWLFVSFILINIIFIRPNTQFQKLGYLIESRQQILNNYFGYKLFLDLFGLIILIIYLASGLPVLVYLKIFFYTNIITVFALDQMVLDKLQLKLYAYAFYRLLRLQIFIVFIVFWLSSIFFAIDYAYYLNGTYSHQFLWITNSICTTGITPSGITFTVNIIQQYPWYIWLNYAAYWCLQTISTVGYGDITPKNPPSVAYTNYTILIAMFFFVFFINSIIEIIDEMTSAEQKQRKTNIKLFKQYYLQSERKMNEISVKFGYSKETIQRNKKMAEETADNIRSYLYEMDLNNLLDEENNVEKLVYNNLTPQLREELFLNYRQLFFKKILLFGEIAQNSAKFIEVYEQLIYKIKEVPYGNGEIVYLNRQKEANSLYFVLKGVVMLKYPFSRYTKLIENYSDKKDKNQNYYQQQFLNFGVREFFTQQPKDHLALTMSYCKIQVLEHQDFVGVIKNYPQFHKKYCEQRDLLMIEEMNILTSEECFQCQSKRHHLLSCDKCLFNIRQSVTKSIYNKGVPNRRRQDGDLLHHSRNSTFMRDPLKTKKINNIRPPHFLQLNKEVIHNCKEYFPYRNLNPETYF